MLESIKFTNVGPAAKLSIEFAERTNIITGDNGLGKTFLLDTAWWALTRTWPEELNPKMTTGLKGRPRGTGDASIELALTGRTKSVHYVSTYDRKREEWQGRAGRPTNPGMILYAMVDGSFGVWDPARNYWMKSGGQDVQDRPAGYVFDPKSVWNGLDSADGKVLCNGLVRDWASWQGSNAAVWETFASVLTHLSPNEDEPLVPGELTRYSLEDVRDMPTLKTQYQDQVPIIHASAATKRIASLAYLLMWSWQEHSRASQLLDQPPTREIIFLVDELEAHLHPKWQRTILRALMTVVRELATEASVQLIATTHSPLVLASLEPDFDMATDALFHFGLTKTNEVVVEQIPWAKQGDVSSWLVSDAFGFDQARSTDAERAIEAAEAFMRGDMASLPVDLATKETIHAELQRVLGGMDDFWPRWLVKADLLPAAVKAPKKARK